MRQPIRYFIYQIMIAVIMASSFSGCKEQGADESLNQGNNSQGNNHTIQSQNSYEVTRTVPGGKYRVDVLDKVTGGDGVTLKLDDVSVLSTNSACEIIRKDDGGFMLATDTSVICDYEYYLGSGEGESPNSELVGVSRVVVTESPQKATLLPFGITAYFDDTTSIDIEQELQAIGDESDLSVYRLRKDVTLVPTDSNSQVVVNEVEKTIDYKPSGDNTGHEEILYSLDNGSGDVISGSIFVTVGNRSEKGIDIQDKNTLAEGVSLGESATVDVSQFVTNIDEDWQLVYVSVFNATVEPTSLTDTQNKSFEFNANMIGDYYVNVVVSDHRGGYDTGLIQIQVVDPDGSGDWGNIQHRLKVFYAPLTFSDAQSQGVEVSGTYFDEGVSATMAAFSYSKAKTYCVDRIGRLPAPDELQEMQAAENPSQQDWPVDLLYWTNDPTKVISLSTGSSVIPVSTTTYNVTCVNEGGFSITNVSGDTIADGSEIGQVSAKLEFNGEPVSGQTINAKVDSATAVLHTDSLVTDSNGEVTFNITDTKAELVNVLLDYNGEVRQTTVGFVADTNTAQLSLDVEVDDQPIKGGVDEVTATLMDLNGNPIVDKEIEIMSPEPNIKIVEHKDTAGVGRTNEEGFNTNKQGQVKIDVTWQGDDFSSDQDSEISAKFIERPEVEDKVYVAFTMYVPKPNSLTVSVTPEEINVDDKAQATAVITLDDGSVQNMNTATGLAWFSTNTDIAIISSSGQVIGKAKGQTQIKGVYQCPTCNEDETVTGTQNITVEQPGPVMDDIEIVTDDNGVITLEVEEAWMLETIAHYDNGTEQKVVPTYKIIGASGENVAVIIGTMITGIKEGEVVIQAEYEGMTDEANVVVRSASQTLALTPETIEMDIGETKEITAYWKETGEKAILDRCSADYSEHAQAMKYSESTCMVFAIDEGVDVLTAEADGQTVQVPITVKRGVAPPPPQDDRDFDGDTSTDKDPTVRSSIKAETLYGGIEGWYNANIGKECAYLNSSDQQPRIASSVDTKQYYACAAADNDKMRVYTLRCPGSANFNPKTAECRSDLTAEESQNMYETVLPESVKTFIQENAY